MSAMTIPTGWVKDGYGNESVTFTRSGHSQSIPRLAILKRQPKTTGSVTSKYQVKYVLGFDWSAVATGANPDGPNSLIDLNIRNTDAQTSSAMKAALTELGNLLLDTGFQADAVDNLSLPIS